MSAIFVLIIISLIVAGGFLALFLWAVRNGQYEDNYTPAVRMLWDDDGSPSGKRQAAGKPGES
jgi:cbb3-type cytochrome oxidase maturation protein